MIRIKEHSFLIMAHMYKCAGPLLSLQNRGMCYTCTDTHPCTDLARAIYINVYTHIVFGRIMIGEIVLLQRHKLTTHTRLWETPTHTAS